MYSQDASGARRPLTHAELERAEVRRGATLLVLADGRKLADASLRRGDFLAAVAALKAAGGFEAALQELNSRSAPSRTSS